MKVTTESGTVYEFTKDGSKVRRLRKRNDVDPEAVERAELRQDGRWLELASPVEPALGKQMVLMMRPIDPPFLPAVSFSVRMSTIVIGIEP